MNVQLLPVNKRMKQLLKEFGPVWAVVTELRIALCFDGPGVLIRSLDGLHERWVKPEWISKELTKGV